MKAYSESGILGLLVGKPSVFMEGERREKGLARQKDLP
jgi:hypothetical protein